MTRYRRRSTPGAPHSAVFEGGIPTSKLEAPTLRATHDGSDTQALVMAELERQIWRYDLSTLTLQTYFLAMLTTQI